MITTKTFLRQAETLDGLTGHKFSKAKIIAERLSVCTRTIFRWADEGKIARHKINARVVLFNESEVMELIRSARVGGAL
jgi:excisionase family DNA binding protein